MLLTKEMNKQEIEDFLNGKGDFVRIDHLTRFIRDADPPIAIKRFALQKLADIYEKKGMFNEAAKLYHSMAIISVAFSEKIKHHVWEAEMYIKAGYFDRADEAVKKAMGEGNASEKSEVYFTIKEFYKKQAEQYTREKRRAHAVKIYDKLLEMNISEVERQEIRKKLLDLYDKLGKVKEFLNLKNSL